MSAAIVHLGERLPVQDLARLTQCGTSVAALQAWLAQLPLMNPLESAPLVNLVVQEVNRLRTDESHRLQLLEVLLPVVQSLCQSMVRHYLTGQVMLGEGPLKVATLAQALQTRMATGYRLVLVRQTGTIPPGRRPPGEQPATLLHRSLSLLVSTLRRVTELYLPAPPLLWRDLHAHYQAARELGVEQVRTYHITNGHSADLSIESVYIRALLMGSCQANRLRQSDITLIYALTELWAPQVSLREGGVGGSQLAVDPQRDSPPVLASDATSGASGLLWLDTVALVRRINSLHGGASGMEARLPHSVAGQLVQAWSESSARTGSRHRHDARLEICLGLKAAHFYLGNEQDFYTQLHGLVGDDDDDSMAPQRREDPLPEVHNVACIDMSLSGYGMVWTAPVPSHLRVGELLGVREAGVHHWTLASVRWVRPRTGAGVQMGLQVVSTNPQPCGCQLLRNNQESAEYLRAFIVPALRAIQQPETVVTPATGFHAGSRVMIMRQGREHKAHLTRLFSSGHGFRQFEFTYEPA